METLETRRLFAAVFTDKGDYAFGETAQITASGFAIGESLQLQVTHHAGTEGSNDDAQNQAWTVTDGSADDLDGLANGEVQAAWLVNDPDAVSATYLLSVQGLSSGELATTTFTDANIVISANTNWSAITTGTGPGGQPGAGDAITINGNATLTVDVSNAIVGGINVNPNTNNQTGTLRFDAGGVLTVTGNISVGGNGNRVGVLNMTSGGLLKVGNQLTFSQNNSGANGVLTAGTGTIEFNRSGSQTIPLRSYNHLTLSGSGAKQVASGGSFTANGIVTIANNVTFDLFDVGNNGGTATIAGLTNSGSGAGAVVTNNNVVTLIINTSGNHAYAGAITNNGDLNVVKAGAGTQTFSGANTYKGTTTVAAGKLLVNGSHIPNDSQLGAYTVNSGATLGGTGEIRGTLTNNGTVDPGVTVGTLQLRNKNASFGAGSFFHADLAMNGPTPVADQLHVNNTSGSTNRNIAVNGSAALDISISSDFTAAINHAFTIINNATGGTTGTFNATGKVNGVATTLSDNATFTTAANQEFRVDYVGNDLVLIYLGQANATPVAQDGSNTTNEDTAVDGAVIATDDDGDTLTYSLVGANGGAASGTVVLDANTGAYTYTPNANFNGADAFSFKANDGTTDSNTATVTINVTAVNDAPVIDLNGGGAGINFATTFTEDGGAVAAVDMANATITDVDDTYLESLTVTLNNRPDGSLESLTADTTGTSVTLTAYYPSTGVLLLSGNAPVSEYQTVLRTVKYNNASQDPDTANRSITFVANDGLADSNAVTTVTVVAVNDAPAVAADEATVVVDEGDTAGNTGTFGDVDSDAVAITASVGTVIKTGAGSGTWSWSYGTSDGPDDSQIVTITATDSEGEETTTTFQLTVNNVAPTVAADQASVTVDEGQTAQNTGTFDDVGADTVTLAASVGTIVDNGDGTWSWSYATTDGPDDSQTVTITATDSDEDSAQTTFELIVKNVAPSVTDGGDVTVDEGQTANNTGTWSDPGADEVTLTASVGTVIKNGDGTWSWSYVTTDGPEDGQTVTITATDSDDEETTTTFQLVVDNVAPTLTISGAASSNEAATYTLNLLSGDPGQDTIQSWTINWGDGDVETITGDPSSVTHVYDDDEPGAADDIFTISATATDEDGTYSANAHNVTVNNLNPTATADGYTTAQATAVTGNVIADDTGSGADSDPAGANDPLTVSAVNGSASGVGDSVHTAHGTVTVNADGSFTYTPDTTFSGTDSFTYTISDGDGGTSTATVSITVTPVAPDTITTVTDTCMGGTALLINGTSSGDNIHVAPGGTSDTLAVTINGVTTSHARPTGRIIIFGNAGDDTITIAGAVTNVAWIYGDGGHDMLNLGNGGGIAWGGIGNDHINGGSGRDILVGGQGADRIVGNPGDDILIAGLSRYDDRAKSPAHEHAWCHIYREWSRTDLTTQSTGSDSSYTAFEQRIDHLTGAVAGGHNGAFYLNNDTVEDDDCYDQIDMLTGSAGEDWFIWTKGEDKVTGMSSTEGAEDLDCIS